MKEANEENTADDGGVAVNEGQRFVVQDEDEEEEDEDDGG